MAYATGRHMAYRQFGHSYEPDEVCGMVRAVFDGRVNFIDGEQTIAPGISLHKIGGHTAGVQCMRVWTKRGWVVLASDTERMVEMLHAAELIRDALGDEVRVIHAAAVVTVLTLLIVAIALLERLVAELTQTLLAAERARFHTLTLAEQRMLAELLHKLALAR